MKIRTKAIFLFSSALILFSSISELLAKPQGVANQGSQRFQHPCVWLVDYPFCAYVDSSVNDMMLWYECIYKIPDSVRRKNEVLYPGADYGWIETNITNDEFLFMQSALGGTGRELDFLILTNSIPSSLSDKTINRRALCFLTSNGAYLGMSLKEFKEKYPNAQYTGFGYNYIDGDSVLWFPYEKFYQIDSCRLMYNRFFFKDGRLVQAHIGFDI